jgi:hypothetical protein
LSIGYKVFEWRNLDKLAELNSKTVPVELSIVEKSDKNYNEAADLFVKLVSEDLTTEEQLDLLEEIDGKLNLALSNSNEYLKALEENRGSYKKLEFPSKLLLGNRGKFARQFIENQLNYYDVEIEGIKENIISDYLAKNIFAVMKDKIIMMDFDDKASVAPTTNYSRYFADIASLEKYTRSDFKFPKEDEIKELFPYGHEMLDNNREYMSAYYSVVKDYVAGDYESAAYKYSRIEEASLELNVDFDRLFSEGEERENERAKKIIEYVVAKNMAIKEFKKDNLGMYPLLPRVDGWKDDLELCQLYSYKASYYNNVLKKYPEAEDFESLITELAQLAPSTSQIDSDFDKAVVEFTNTDELIQFKCTDGEVSKAYTFTTTK